MRDELQSEADGGNIQDLGFRQPKGGTGLAETGNRSRERGDGENEFKATPRQTL